MVSSSSHTTTVLVKPEPDDDISLAMNHDSIAQSHIQSYCAQHDDTPSFNSIITAYHREGKGDRELLLAILKAKRAEDERLTARDRLQAEQLSAQSMYHARYLAYFYAHSPYSSQFFPNPFTANTSSAFNATSSPSTDTYVRSRESSYSSSTATSPPAAFSPIFTAKGFSSSSSTSSRKRSAPMGNEEITREEALRALRNKLARQSPPTQSAAKTDACRKRSTPTPPISPTSDTGSGNGGMDVLLTAVDQERRAMRAAEK